MNCPRKNQHGAFSVNNVPATKPAFGEVVTRKPARQQPQQPQQLQSNWDKYILQLGKIQFAIGTNTFYNWEKSSRENLPVNRQKPQQARYLGELDSKSMQGDFAETTFVDIGRYL